MSIAAESYVDLTTGLALASLGIYGIMKVRQTNKSRFAYVQLGFIVAFGVISLTRFIILTCLSHSSRLAEQVRCERVLLILLTLFYLLAVQQFYFAMKYAEIVRNAALQNSCCIIHCRYSGMLIYVLYSALILYFGGVIIYSYPKPDNFK